MKHPFAIYQGANCIAVGSTEATSPRDALQALLSSPSPGGVNPDPKTWYRIRVGSGPDQTSASAMGEEFATVATSAGKDAKGDSALVAGEMVRIEREAREVLAKRGSKAKDAARALDKDWSTVGAGGRPPKATDVFVKHFADLVGKMPSAAGAIDPAKLRDLNPDADINLKYYADELADRWYANKRLVFDPYAMPLGPPNTGPAPKAPSP